MGHLYFCWPWALTSAWYLVLQVSSGYKMVLLSSAPTAPEVASDKDWRSTAISLIVEDQDESAINGRVWTERKKKKGSAGGKKERARDEIGEGNQCKQKLKMTCLGEGDGNLLERCFELENVKPFSPAALTKASCLFTRLYYSFSMIRLTFLVLCIL